MSEVTNVKDGLYILGEENTPMKIATAVYGDPRKYHEIISANSDVEWEPGISLRIPNRLGRTTQVQVDETTFELISRMFPGQMIHLYLDRFYTWNDGYDAEDLVGQTVFIPER